MEARLRGPERNAERGRHLRNRLADIDMEHDERAELGIEPPQGGIERFALRDVAFEISGMAEVIDVDRQLDLNGSTPLAAGQPEARTHGQAMDPGLESIGVAQARQVPPRRDQRFLDGIPSQLGIPKDEPGGPAETTDQHAGERGEGVMIAPLRALHE